MGETLQRELHQTKPFASLEVEAALSIVRTAALINSEITETLRPHGLTPAQYNVLRILRGAHEEGGLCRFEISDRLVTPGPDVTRLLDRLEAEGLVSRSRDPEDLRRKQAQVTLQGLDLLGRLDEEIEVLHRRQLGHIEEERLRGLTAVLAEAREER